MRWDMWDIPAKWGAHVFLSDLHIRGICGIIRIPDIQEKHCVVWENEQSAIRYGTL